MKKGWQLRLSDVVFWILGGLAAIWFFWIMEMEFSFPSLGPLIGVLLLKIAFMYIVGLIKEPKDILKLFK